MARVNINILGIKEVKLTGMGEFKSNDHYIYYCVQESLRRNGVAIIVNKRVQNAVLGCNLKNDRMISVHFQGKPFNIMVIQAYTPTSNAEEAEVEWFYEDLQDLLELTTTMFFFITGDWNAKVRSQEIPGVTGKLCLGVQNEAGQKLIEFCQENALVIENTNKICHFHYTGLKCKGMSQETLGVTCKFGLGVQNEAWQRLIVFCQENTLVIANTLFPQHKRRLYTWTSPDGQHQNQIILFAAKDGEDLYSQQKQQREQTMAQITNSLLPNSDLN